MIEVVERRADVEDISRDDARLIVSDSREHLLREDRERLRELYLGRVSEGRRVKGDIGNSAGFRDYRAGARVGVLSVGTRVAVEIERVLKDEVYILDAAVRQIVEYNSADADRLGDLILVLNIRVLLGHDLADLLYRLGEELLEDNDVSGSRREL